MESKDFYDFMLYIVRFVIREKWEFLKLPYVIAIVNSKILGDKLRKQGKDNGCFCGHEL